MSHPGIKIDVHVDASQTYQQIDGFGVNINSRYFDTRLLPAMDLLANDLGATLYRVDIWGKSNWIDPTGSLGRAALDPSHQAEILSGEIFRRGWDMMRWLNQHGIQPYLTASGIVPTWMLAEDGKTLADYDAFAEMMAAMLDWAKNKEKLDFTLFGPLNETDIGDPEGPTVDPMGYVKACEALDAKLSARELDDIRFVVAEQSHFDANYIAALANSPRLKERIAVFALHDYSDISPARYEEINAVLRSSPQAGKPLWMTEFGDLEQSGEREWYVAWVMASRLFDQLEAGYRAALAWDAYDNYHDHDEYWTIYGLLRTGLRAHTPKKRYYALKQVYRFVRPGFLRLEVLSDDENLRVLAFASPDLKQVTVVGINAGLLPARLNVVLNNFPAELKSEKINLYLTGEQQNCTLAQAIPMQGGNWPFTGIDACIPPATIFTLTNVAGI
jgi:O-glycosyl hydrolase